MSIRAPQDRHLAAALTITVALGLALGACESPPRSRPWRHAPDPASAAEAAPRSPVLAADDGAADLRARRAHTLRIHMDAEPRHLNPMLAPSVWTRRIAMGTVFEPLIKYAPPDGGAGAGPGRYLPALARSWRVDGDGLAIYFELEPGVTFHDGQPLTASDVQFSLDTARDPRKGADHLWPLLADVTSVDKISPRMVRVVLSRPDGFVLRAIAEVPILPYHVYEPGLAAGGKLVGSGPWQLISWKDGVVHLGRYAGYWGKAPAIADLEFVYQPDAARALIDAKRGDLDLVPALIPAHLDQAQAPGIAQAFAPLALAPPRFRYLVLDAGGPPFDDARVRRALALLVDRKSLCGNFLHGLARPVAGPVWPGGPVDGAAPAPPDVDPRAAARLLDDAGWIDADKDGIRERGGVPLRISLVVVERDTPPEPGKKLEPERQQMVDLLTRAGFLVEVKPGSEAVVQKRIADGHFGAALLEWDGMVDSDLSRWLETGGARNAGHFSSHRFDQIFAGLRGDWEPAQRVRHAAELALAIADEQPIVALAAAQPRGLIHRRVTGVVVWDGWIDLTRLAFDPKNDPLPGR
jgi:peptide/nickel transport system substrate-binding protein